MDALGDKTPFFDFKDPKNDVFWKIWNLSQSINLNRILVKKSAIFGHKLADLGRKKGCPIFFSRRFFGAKISAHFYPTNLAAANADVTKKLPENEMPWSGSI